MNFFKRRKFKMKKKLIKLNNKAQVSAELLVIMATVIAAAVIITSGYVKSVKKINTKYTSNVAKAIKSVK